MILSHLIHYLQVFCIKREQCVPIECKRARLPQSNTLTEMRGRINAILNGLVREELRTQIQPDRCPVTTVNAPVVHRSFGCSIPSHHIL